MVQDAPSLYPEIKEARTPPAKGEHGYYRRPRDPKDPRSGWIVTAPCWPTFRADMEFKGCTFLPQYGTFPLDLPGNATTRDIRGLNYSAVDEPWRMFFQRGGVHEFPPEQIIGYRWHLKPPYQEVTFPQMEGVKVFDLPCPECATKFAALTLQGVVQQLRQHLQSKSNGQHEYTPTDLRELGKEWDINFDVRRTVQTSKPDLPKEADSGTDDGGTEGDSGDGGGAEGDVLGKADTGDPGQPPEEPPAADREAVAAAPRKSGTKIR